MTEITFRVPDMSCAHCKAAVEDELNRLPGVVSSNADLEKGTVEVSCDESRVGTEELEGAHDYAAALLALLLGTVYWLLRLARTHHNSLTYTPWGYTMFGLVRFEKEC